MFGRKSRARASVMVNFFDGTIISAIQLDPNQDVTEEFGTKRDDKRASVYIGKKSLKVHAYSRHSDIDVQVRTLKDGSRHETSDGPGAEVDISMNLTEDRSLMFYVVIILVLVGLLYAKLVTGYQN